MEQSSGIRRRMKDRARAVIVSRCRGGENEARISFFLSRNGIVNFIRNNKSQHIKISYYKVSASVAFTSACSKCGGKVGFTRPFYVLHITQH